MDSLLYLSLIPPVWDTILNYLDFDALKSLRLTNPKHFPLRTKQHFVKYLETITYDLSQQRFKTLADNFTPEIAGQVKNLTIQAVCYRTSDLDYTIKEASSYTIDEAGRKSQRGRRKRTVQDIKALKQERDQIRALAVQQREDMRHPDKTLDRLKRLLIHLPALDTMNLVGVIRNGKLDSVDRLSVPLPRPSGFDPTHPLDDVSGFAFHVCMIALIEAHVEITHLDVYAQASAREWGFTSCEPTFGAGVLHREPCTLTTAALENTVKKIQAEHSNRSDILKVQTLAIQAKPFSSCFWMILLGCVRYRMQSIESLRITATTYKPRPPRDRPLSPRSRPHQPGPWSSLNPSAPHCRLENFEMKFEGLSELLLASGGCSHIELRNIHWDLNSVGLLPKRLTGITPNWRLRVQVLSDAGFREETLQSWLGNSFPFEEAYEPEPGEYDRFPQMSIVIEESDYWEQRQSLG